MKLRLTSHRVGTQSMVAHSEGAAGGVARLAFGEMVPAHLLDGGEIVHFSIRPSPWFVALESMRWFAFAGMLISMALWGVIDVNYRDYVIKLAILIAGSRMLWASLEWVSRMYVLTNRRVMSIHGVFRAELFECALDRIQSTQVTANVGEKMVRAGTVSFQPMQAEGVLGGMHSWRTVARPHDIHDKLRHAIERSRNPGG
ncbi:MAG: PH domain-containing protein [Planctomycetes bacterium]|nr:PH domain-containing protein [Planctomycetota bacterium]